jgi:hypothetical protein
MWIQNEGSWEKACIAWVHSVLLEMDQTPDSTSDWLKIDLESARENYQAMLRELKDWLGIEDRSSTRNAVTVKLWRSDTNQTDPN